MLYSMQCASQRKLKASSDLRLKMQLASADGVGRVHQTHVSPDVAASVASP